MTFEKTIAKVREIGYGAIFYREGWDDGRYIKPIGCRFEMHNKDGEIMDSNYRISYLEIICNDWEFFQDKDDLSSEDYNYGVYACVNETEDGTYVGSVAILTDEYECPRDAIDSIVAFAEEYELGFDASDIDISEVLDTIGHKCEDES